MYFPNSTFSKNSWLLVFCTDTWHSLVVVTREGRTPSGKMYFTIQGDRFTREENDCVIVCSTEIPPVFPTVILPLGAIWFKLASTWYGTVKDSLTWYKLVVADLEEFAIVVWSNLCVNGVNPPFSWMEWDVLRSKIYKYWSTRFIYVVCEPGLTHSTQVTPKTKCMVFSYIHSLWFFGKPDLIHLPYLNYRTVHVHNHVHAKLPHTLSLEDSRINFTQDQESNCRERYGWRTLLKEHLGYVIIIVQSVHSAKSPTHTAIVVDTRMW